jgi:hypothetical protein
MGLTSTVPASDFYGVVVFSDKRAQTGSYSLTFEELNDCDNIPSGSCVSSVGNVKDFHMGALSNSYWLVVGVLPSDEDDKDIAVFSQCDGGGTEFAVSAGIDGADFIVADCNHPPASGSAASPEPLANNWYPRVVYGSPSEAYSVSCDLSSEISEDLFPHHVLVEGGVMGTSGDCGMIKIWDVYLQQGVQYKIGFTRSGGADFRLALFRNPTNYRLWSSRLGAEWELEDSQNFSYTAPATDYYGLVVFANRRDRIGNYTIFISSGVTGVEDEAPAPESYTLYQNTPNPFNPTTTIRYDLPAGGAEVDLAIYDVVGRRVKQLAKGFQTPGVKTAVWDGRDDSGQQVATGVYFCRLRAGSFTSIRKMAFLK